MKLTLGIIVVIGPWLDNRKEERETIKERVKEGKIILKGAVKGLKYKNCIFIVTSKCIMPYESEYGRYRGII